MTDRPSETVLRMPGDAPLLPVMEYLAHAGDQAARLGYTDPRLAAAYQKHVLMLLTLAYVEVFGTCIEKPDWVPHIPVYFPWGSPNPDDIYRFVPIDPAGSYRLSGIRGTSPVALITMRRGGAHLGEINGRTLFEVDLTTIEADEAGRYEFMFSAQRPADYSGTWFELNPETQSLLYRSRTDHPGQTDPVCTIERLDTAPAPTPPDHQTIAHKVRMAAQYATRQNELVLGYLNNVRTRGGDKDFIFDDQSGYGSVANQRTLMHTFTLEPDEALILETDLPGVIRYWSVQLYDAHFTAIDYVFRQSSLNGASVQVDSDGKARLVVCGRDPGVANWLDCADWPSAGILWRWSYADVYPLPHARKVELVDLERELPADTARVDPAERQARLAARSAYYQTRGR